MNVFFLNTNFEKIGVTDTWESLIWTESYCDAGDFELYMPVNPGMSDIIQIGNYVMREDDTTRLMMIESIRLSTDAEDGDHMTVSGRSVEALLSRRIVWSQTNLSGALSACADRLVQENLTNPTISARKIPGVSIQPGGIDEVTVRKQLTGTNLLEAVSELLGTYHKGFRLTFDGSGLTFETYQGINRSLTQSAVPHVVFQPEAGNIITSTSIRDVSRFANTAIVAGEGEGTNRKRYILGSTQAGLDRYETYVDARDISSITETGVLSDESYSLLLRERGDQALADAAVVEGFEAEIEARCPYIYGEDYDLGDIVQIEDGYGTSVAVRITSVTQAWDDTGHTVIPVLKSEEV